MIDCFFPQAMRNQFRIRGKAMTSVTVAKNIKMIMGHFYFLIFLGPTGQVTLENLHS